MSLNHIDMDKVPCGTKVIVDNGSGVSLTLTPQKYNARIDTSQGEEPCIGAIEIEKKSQGATIKLDETSVTRTIRKNEPLKVYNNKHEVTFVLDNVTSIETPNWNGVAKNVHL